MNKMKQYRYGKIGGWVVVQAANTLQALRAVQAQLAQEKLDRERLEVMQNGKYYKAKLHLL